ncbi:hypothetical protein AX17_005974 [Amanita inopinata Kibby_2008]|nr:hypothetical protein AX17_005974 [Amanita inopinata Kibby_2008]
MRHPELPIIAFFTAVLVIIPLPWHWRARNVATVALMLWLFAVDVIYGVNAIIWAGNVDNSAPIWCDIATKVVVGASYALPLSTLCICKHLELVSSSRKASYDLNDKHRRIIFETVMCFGAPSVFMALHYVVQGHRFDIFEDLGCQATLYISVPAVFIVWLPQLLFSVITLIYAAIALHHFIRRRLVFTAHLQNSNSALTTNRYLRLIAMSTTEMFWGTAFTAYNMYSNMYHGLRPWTNWADVHSNFSRIRVFPAAVIPSRYFRPLMVFWWALPASSFIFFVFFGLGEESLKEYRKVWLLFKKHVLRISNDKGHSIIPTSLPRFKGLRPLHLVERSIDREKQVSPPPYPSRPSTVTVAPTSPTKSDTTLDNESLMFTTVSYHGRDLSTVQQQTEVEDSNASLVSRCSSPHSVAQPDLSLLRDNLRSPVYHPPFGFPSVLPINSLNPLPENGIFVTIHRQASADDVA